MTDYIIIFHPKAEIEFLEAFEWYEERLEGLGFRFETCVERRLKAITAAPLIYPLKNYNCRESKVEDFPFLVVYKLYPRKRTLLIISIFHTSRKPDRKYKKKL
ncbi:type II toxin-antitoxin system RelE/ParE family toxin [Mucilaginibacter sp.]|uniref:type II toxin-antitoxin system RelE/ParE family toxin n=1 Tax=Mucilaginibacter sp. TaxID=1882438 RepID=UPI00356B211E